MIAFLAAMESDELDGT